MSTVRDLINSSLRKIGAIASGETCSAAEQSDAMVALNHMLDSWSNEGLVVFAKARESFPLVPGQSSYTMGPAGDFDTPRALKIERAAVEIITNGTAPIEITLRLINQDQYAEIRIKDLVSTLPRDLYAEGTNPLEIVRLYPIPSDANNLIIYSWKPLATFANASNDVEFPPGYIKALIYGLAIELAPEYGKPLDPTIAAQYAEAKKNVMRMNSKPVYLRTDLAGTGRRFNILTGE